MRTIEWHDGTVVTIDQTKLPHKEIFITIKNKDEMAEAIRTMKIRGAPLLGAAAAYALALTAFHSKAKGKDALIQELEKAADAIRRTRPTAVNLFWALDRILEKAKSFSGNGDPLAASSLKKQRKLLTRMQQQIGRLAGTAPSLSKMET